MLYVTSLSFVSVYLRLSQSNIKDIKNLYVLWNNKLNVDDDLKSIHSKSVKEINNSFLFSRSYVWHYIN